MTPRPDYSEFNFWICEAHPPPYRGVSPEELSAAKSYSHPGRRAEYLTVRELWHQIYGAGAPSLLNDADGAPTFPAQVSGSISHKDGVVALCLGPRDHAVGIDVELPDRVGLHLKDKILRPEEQVSLEMCPVLGKCDEVFRLALMFSAKEAIYKALYPLGRKYFGFHAGVFQKATTDQTMEFHVLEPVISALKPPIQVRVTYATNCWGERPMILTFVNEILAQQDL